MTDSISMEQTNNGTVKVTVGNISMEFPDYVAAAEWAETMMYGEVERNG